MKTFKFMIFNRDTLVNLYHNWNFKDCEGNFYFQFNLFNFHITSESMIITILNFSINIWTWA